MKHLTIIFIVLACTISCSASQQTVVGVLADSTVVGKDSSINTNGSEETDVNSLHVSAIGKYCNYYTMFYRMYGVATTYGFAYTLTMKDSVANNMDSVFCYTLKNQYGPRCTYGNRYGLYRKAINGWQRVPFIDNLYFTDLAYVLDAGVSAEGKFYSSVFATSLRKGVYSLRKDVSFDIHPHFKLMADSILPAGESMQGAFECRILPSRSDTIRMLIVNHTQNICRLNSLPSILDANSQTCHPLTNSGHTKAFEWMHAKGMIRPGEGMLLVAPTTWNVKDIDRYRRDYFKSGRLAEGEYSVSTSVNIELTAEFKIK